MLRCCLRRAAKNKSVSYRCKGDFVDSGLLPAHKPDAVEKGKYDDWLKKGAFTVEADGTRENVFSLILPPPNVTGSLHLGHALTATVQDVLARYHRSSKKVMWLPGLDHAGIATQVAVEKYIEKKLGVTRQELGREAFIEEVWKWKQKYGTQILQQLKNLGCSLDWSRETFTMDDQQAKAVRTAFIKLFDEGLIFRSEELVNWCCHLQTAISDIEVNHVPVSGPTEIRVPGYDEPVVFGLLYHFSYELSDGSGNVTVATTRPETILGDVALVVNPSDDRNTKYIGRKVVHPFTGEELPIMFDEAVDPEFGSGVLKITPAHDKLDFRIAKKLGLKSRKVISEEGTICDGFGEFSFQKRMHVRKAIIQILKSRHLMVKEVPHGCDIPTCSRSGDVIELIPKPQWFLSVDEMSDDAKKAVERGTIEIEPDSYKTDWTNWLSNRKDWCISRQLWWGHRIPVYRCTTAGDESGTWVAAQSSEEAAIKAARKLGATAPEIACQQDGDVLDTWFSSGLYPFASLGWPDNTPDYRSFYPLSVMITGQDILLFWVYRMIILGKKLTGQYPFTKVFLHGVICDDKGAKMSKSKGNVIDPEDIANGASYKKLKGKLDSYRDDGIMTEFEYQKASAYLKSQYPKGFPACGHDALRFTLCSRNLTAKFITIDPEECRTNALFCNKIWNCAKFTRHSFNALNSLGPVDCAPTLNVFDRWILSRLANLTNVVSGSMNSMDLHFATGALRDFLYRDLCDLYLETTKPSIWAVRDRETATESDISAALGHCQTLSVCLDAALRCLHPFMPFITEELLPKIPHLQDGRVIYKKFDPQLAGRVSSSEHQVHDESESIVEQLKEIIDAVRHLKTMYTSARTNKPWVVVETANGTLAENVHRYEGILKFLCGVGGLTSDASVLENLSSFVYQRELSADCTVHMVRPKDCLNEEELELLVINEQRLAKKLTAMEKKISAPNYRATGTERQEHLERIAVWSKEIKHIRNIIHQQKSHLESIKEKSAMKEKLNNAA